MCWCQMVNYLFCWLQVLQSVKDNISFKDVDGQGVDFFDVLVVGVKIVGGQIQFYCKNKDEEYCSDVL